MYVLIQFTTYQPSEAEDAIRGVFGPFDTEAAAEEYRKRFCALWLPYAIHFMEKRAI